MARRRAANLDEARERARLYTQGLPWTIQREARYQLNLAVARGEISRPSECSDCGCDGLIHGHHDDYRQPLVVVWLCPLCHATRHRHERVAPRPAASVKPTD